MSLDMMFPGGFERCLFYVKCAFPSPSSSADGTKPVFRYLNDSRFCTELMEIRKCSNSACGKYFQFNAFDIPLRKNDEPREVECPHCGHFTGEQSRETFIVHGLAPEQEASLVLRNYGERR